MEKDPQLWREAKARMGFRLHFTMYLCVIILMWSAWAYSGTHTHPWPIYLMFGWGIGILFHFLGAYRYFDKLTENEYRKLKK